MTSAGRAEAGAAKAAAARGPGGGGGGGGGARVWRRHGAAPRIGTRRHAVGRPGRGGGREGGCRKRAREGQHGEESHGLLLQEGRGRGAAAPRGGRPTASH